MAVRRRLVGDTVRGRARRDRAAREAGYSSWEGFLEELRRTADCGEIAVRWGGLEVRPAGDGWLARCPFHNDRTPSLSLSGNLYCCHGASCGAQGDAIGLAMRLTGADFTRTALDLAADFGMAAPVLRTESGGRAAASPGGPPPAGASARRGGAAEGA